MNADERRLQKPTDHIVGRALVVATRLHLAFILIVGAALACGGCHSHMTPQKQAALEERAFQAEARNDSLRVLPEDKRPKQKLDVKSTTSDALGGVRAIFIDFPRRLYDRWRGNTAAKYAREMEDNSPDLRRTGILKLSNYPFARDLHGPEVIRYTQIARTDKDPLVQAAAIRALNRARDSKATPIFIKGLGDPDMLVRLESAKALANIPDTAAIPALEQHLASDENKDVRIACADALRMYKTVDCAHALINTLTDRDFSVAWQSHRSLRLMTAQDFGYDEAAWLGYVSQSQNPFR